MLRERRPMRSCAQLPRVHLPPVATLGRGGQVVNQRDQIPSMGVRGVVDPRWPRSGRQPCAWRGRADLRGFRLGRPRNRLGSWQRVRRGTAPQAQRPTRSDRCPSLGLYLLGHRRGHTPPSPRFKYAALAATIGFLIACVVRGGWAFALASLVVGFLQVGLLVSDVSNRKPCQRSMCSPRRWPWVFPGDGHVGSPGTVTVFPGERPDP